MDQVKRQALTQHRQAGLLVILTRRAPRLKVEEQLCSVAFSSSAPLPISAVAQELGYELQHDQLIRVGATVARLYREKHHIEPPKKASVHGDERRVNAYTEADRDLIVSALNQFFGT